MNRHTKRMLVTILLSILLGSSGLIGSVANAGFGLPGITEPPARIVENP